MQRKTWRCSCDESRNVTCDVWRVTCDVWQHFVKCDVCQIYWQNTHLPRAIALALDMKNCVERMWGECDFVQSQTFFSSPSVTLGSHWSLSSHTSSLTHWWRYFRDTQKKDWWWLTQKKACRPSSTTRIVVCRDASLKKNANQNPV